MAVVGSLFTTIILLTVLLVSQRSDDDDGYPTRLSGRSSFGGSY